METVRWRAEAALYVVRLGTHRAPPNTAGTWRTDIPSPKNSYRVYKAVKKKKAYIYIQWALCLEVLFISVRTTITNSGTISKQLLLDSGHKILFQVSKIL